MIKSFKCKETRSIFNEERSKKLPASIQVAALRKLLILDAASSLQDLRRLPGNRLEPLKGHRSGRHSIRVNDQFRICFVWTGHDAEDVEIVDCH